MMGTHVITDTHQHTSGSDPTWINSGEGQPWGRGWETSWQLIPEFKQSWQFQNCKTFPFMALFTWGRLELGQEIQAFDGVHNAKIRMFISQTCIVCVCTDISQHSNCPSPSSLNTPKGQHAAWASDNEDQDLPGQSRTKSMPCWSYHSDHHCCMTHGTPHPASCPQPFMMAASIPQLSTLRLAPTAAEQMLYYLGLSAPGGYKEALCFVVSFKTLFV